MSAELYPPSVETHDVAMTDALSSRSSSNSSYRPEAASPSYPPEPVTDASGSRCRKRRSQIRSSETSRAKRLRPLYSDGYHRLFNQTVLKAAHRDKGRNSTEDSRPTQLGITKWTPSEQATFFEMLAFRGRDDLPGLAAAIGTKSEPEIRAYLLQVDEASTNQQIYEPLDSLLDQAEIPAALDVSQECETALEDAADALALLQQKEDIKAEKERHGKQWLLTPKISRTLSEQLSDEVGTAAEIAPAANLLNLPNFLSLMEQLFMNSTNPDYDYRTYAPFEHMQPCIFYTAFCDLHTLVVSLTRRIIQSVVFLALSRQRAEEESRRNLQGVIKQVDVMAALGILGLKANSHDYWVGLARRCKLDVYEGYVADDIRTNSLGEPLAYADVEKILDQDRRDTEQYARERLEISDPAAMPFDDETHSSTSTDTDSQRSGLDANPDNDSSTSVDLSSDYRSSDRSRIQHYQHQAEDAYITSLDNEASLREEVRLWHILDREPPQEILPQDVDIPQKPTLEPKPLEDIGGWREMTTYAAEWETFGSTVPNGDFHRIKNRLSSKAASSTTSMKGKQRESFRSPIPMPEDRAPAALSPGPASENGPKDVTSALERSIKIKNNEEEIDSDSSIEDTHLGENESSPHPSLQEDSEANSGSESAKSLQGRLNDLDVHSDPHPDSTAQDDRMEISDSESKASSRELLDELHTQWDNHIQRQGAFGQRAEVDAESIAGEDD